MTRRLEQGSVAFTNRDVLTTSSIPISQTRLLGEVTTGTLLLPINPVQKYVCILCEVIHLVVMSDRLASFEWIDHSAVDVSRFAHALVASCANASTIYNLFFY
jgi:hypothetical protein